MNYLPLAFLLIAVLSITMVEKANADTTFGYTTGTLLHLGTSTASGQNCGTIHGSDTSATLLELVQQSQFTGSCDSTWWRWDISSIPTNVVIKSASIKYDYTVINQPNANEKCQIRSQVVHDPITATISALWSQDQNSGNIIIDNDTACTSTTSGNTVSLPSSALTDIQNNLSAHWYAVVLKYAAVPNNRPAGSSYYATNSGNVQLQNVYRQDSIPPTASASPAGATYTSAQSVTLAASEPATIYYTKDGTTPTTSSAVYSSPISIGTSTTLKFYAKDEAGNTGTVVTQVYTIDTTPPTASTSPAGATYTSAQSVTLAASEPATIYYTKDGTTPTTSSAIYKNPISISSSTTLKFFAKDAAGNIGIVVTQVYTIDTTPPTVSASPAGGTYTSAKSVTLAASEPATIYYTKDGTTPTTSSAVYSSPISIGTSTTLKFYAKDTAGNIGIVVTKVYTIDTTPPTVSASPAGATYTSAQSVTLAASEPATIYYTKDGTTPTTSSAVYSSPISIGTSTTLKFYAKDTAGNIGIVVTQVYTIDTTPPTVSASPAGATYTSAQSVTLAASEPATIYYTKDGTTPTTSSAVYSSPISIGTSTTLKFYAKDTAGNTGPVVTQVYTIDTTPPTASASPAGATYTSAQSVTLAASEPATIYYTKDGTTPTTSSAVYSSPISIGTSTTLKFYAKDTAG